VCTTHTHTHAYIYIYIYACVCACVCVCVCVCVYARVCAHITHTYIHKDGCGFVGVVERREKREWVCLFVHVQA